MKKFIILCSLFLFLQIVWGKEIPKIAVMEIIDNTGSLNQKMLKTEEDQMRTQVVKKGKGKIKVISTVEQGKAISRMQKESYRLDRDRAGQIELGKMMSAREIVYTVVSSFGAKFTVSSTLIDLKTGNNINATSEDFDGGSHMQQSLRAALEKNIDFLIGEMEDPDKISKAEKEMKTEMDFCKKARLDATSGGWISYLRRYPDGVCAEEAERELDNIACEAARRRNTVDAWQEYLKNYPSGKCAYEADTKIMDLKRTEKIKQERNDEDEKSKEMLRRLKEKNRNRKY